MKQLLVLSFILFALLKGQGQIVQSSCTAPDSIVVQYVDDAQRLALRRIHQNHLTYEDSVEIPKSMSDTVLHALLAIYNATGLPGRDSVISTYNIHIYAQPFINEIMVKADSTLLWMQNLKAGIIPTGDSSVDSIIEKYGLSIESFITWWNIFNYYTVIFKSDSNYNIPAMGHLFESIPGVFGTELNGLPGEGNNISDSIYTDHIEIVYSYGWGDCPSGCAYRRYWKFNVYWDCSVEFVESYGNQVLGLTESPKKTNIVISPNPFDNFIQVKGIAPLFSYSITDLAGKDIKSGVSENNRISNLNSLFPGLYLLKVNAGNKGGTFKIVKL